MKFHSYEIYLLRQSMYNVSIENSNFKNIRKEGKEIPALAVGSCKNLNPPPFVWHSIRYLVFSCGIHLHTWCQTIADNFHNTASVSCKTLFHVWLKDTFSGFCMFLLWLPVCWPHLCQSLYITWYPMKYDVRCYISHIIFPWVFLVNW